MKEGGVKGEILERYAQALLSLAQDNNILDQVGNDVNSILGVLKESPDLQEFLDNPLIKPADKKAVMNRILGDSVHPYTRNFIQVLVDRRRIMFLEGICKEFQALLRKLNQTVLAEVTSARELTDDQKNSLREKVLAMTGARQVELETHIDPELIGGVVIRIGSQVIDASLRGQLRRLSLRLNTVA
ncbi:ATP synthase F1 subunit delta [Leptodesmis sichuanensis]|uniref:ATP synthase F1 subunit delta n=1 Tax=Leptodesmis sichuanensis TaxID=2906798 RepID=UPI001F286999|nr:ATP synthase F1 subunit delta [Leptodesmis sichuanensis]UIE36405.1 F0F1 ATP synthase subunit delta [Leptodesmis sichuanensis A121]